MDEEKLKRQNRLVIGLVFVLIIAGLAIHQYFNYALRPVTPQSQSRVTVVIPRGTTDDEVGTILQKKRLIRSAFVFSYYLQTHKTSGVKAGRFVVKRSLTVPQIVNQLQDSRAAKQQH
ncbi:endolytic transglycosylase MltG [Limosilactobacillus sp.]|uniref:endolytic transglycosylase MltG n=1 Tax=Limosilactobacillus sp. TaxID=2773925 RepID=UPI003F06077F